jgi:hypothetical protein
VATSKPILVVRWRVPTGSTAVYPDKHSAVAAPIFETPITQTGTSKAGHLNFAKNRTFKRGLDISWLVMLR